MSEKTSRQPVCKETGLTKRQVQDALVGCYKIWASLLDTPDDGRRQFHVTVWQEVPSDPRMLLPPSDPQAITADAKRTAAEVITMWMGRPFAGVGFATLNTKMGDVWDPTFGVRVAVGKAIASIARQVVLGETPTLVVHYGPPHRSAWGRLSVAKSC